MGHARALVTAIDPEALAQEVDRAAAFRCARPRSCARFGKPGTRARRAGSATRAPSADIDALERQLGDLLGLTVRITHSADGGSVTLHYSTLDQLDMICQRLSGERI